MKILTGNPGTGKHTISKLISRKLNFEIIDINKIAISEGLFKENNEAFDVDVDKLKKIIDKMNSKNSILVGHLAPYVISPKNVEIDCSFKKKPIQTTINIQEKKIH